MNHEKVNSDSMKPQGDQLIAFKIPYSIHSEDKINQVLTPQVIKQAVQHEESLSIGKAGFIELTKKKCVRPLYQIKKAQYRNKLTGQIITKIQESKMVETYYENLKLTDFQRFLGAENNGQELIGNLKRKIIESDNYQERTQFRPQCVTFLKPFHLGILAPDLLSNKVKNTQKSVVKSNQILYGEKIPISSSNIPEFIKNSKIFEVVKQYFEKRPCWLRNVLVYQLRQDGYKGEFTINELKNILKFLSYIYKDGPWKHVFCRYDFNPLENVEAVLFQSILVKIKQKQIDDYDVNEESDNVYDPTFKEMPKKFMKLYQLADIDNGRIQQILESAVVANNKCTKQYGWLSKREFVEINGTLKNIRDQKSTIE